MANILEKMGLIQRESDIDEDIMIPETNTDYETPISEPVPQIDAEQVAYDNLIESIYQQAGLTTDSASIFTIKQYIDILPAEMTTVKKQASIAGILTVNNININDIIANGNKRRDTLDAAEASIKSENEAIIVEAEEDIERLKTIIEAAQKKITDAKDKISKSVMIIHEEIDAISDLLEFAKGIVKTEEGK